MSFRRELSKLLLITLLSATILVPGVAKADQYDNYIAAGQQHNVISNADFIDINSMSVTDIQNFLVANGSYLKDYVDNSAAGMGRTAAQIIWDASHGKYEAAGSANGVVINESTGTVNPQVILVFLQKEQSLISTSYYDAWKMLASMGYACYAGVSGDYNGNNCKDSTEGFTLQVEWGAWQLRYNYEIAGKDDAWWNLYYGSATKYNVGATITAGTSRTPPDSYQVTLSNQATASCYRYTPYVFFGNYNVWNLYYNTYDFDDINSGLSGINDTTSVSITTFSSSIELSGGKQKDMKLYFNGTEITGYGPITWKFSFVPEIGARVYYVTYGDDDNKNQALKHIHIERHKIADIDGDGSIGITDLAMLAEIWNQTNPANEMCDLNSDSVVDITDLAILAENWGR